MSDQEAHDLGEAEFSQADGAEAGSASNTPAEQPSDSPVDLPAGVDFRSGLAAICGLPNVGKSTLMNGVLGQRLAIVTAKPQTTRRRLLGIYTTENYQVVFVDTPGILEPRYNLQELMMREVAETLRDADLVLYLTDAREPTVAPGIELAAKQKPVLAILNKADLLRHPEDSLPAIDRLRASGLFADFFVISAKEARGIAPLLARIAQLLPPGPHFYPDDQVTQQPERFFVGELIRETVFEQFREEVPYSTEVEITDFREQPGRKDVIEATIHVESESQKAILIGKSGVAIRDLGRRARQSIEAFLERPVYLVLTVKVFPNWRRDPRALKRFGYTR